MKPGLSPGGPLGWLMLGAACCCGAPNPASSIDLLDSALTQVIILRKVSISPNAQHIYKMCVFERRRERDKGVHMVQAQEEYVTYRAVLAPGDSCQAVLQRKAWALEGSLWMRKSPVDASPHCFAGVLARVAACLEVLAEIPEHACRICRSSLTLQHLSATCQQ